MKLILSLILIASLIDAHCQTKIDFVVRGNVPTIKQPKKMDCWITVTTMMMSWKDGKSYTVAETAERLGDPWKLYYELDSGLPDKDAKKFLDVVKMKGEAPASHSIEAYQGFVNDYGPIWITTGDGFSAHARILIGLSGDGSYEKTAFILIDPASGDRVKQPALEFLSEFEKEAKFANRVGWKELRIQLYHF